MELRHELLIVEVAGDGVGVEARLDFALREVPADRVLTFPIPPPCESAEGFEAELAGPGLPPTTLATRLSGPGLLPMGEVAETYDIELPAAAVQEHGPRLVVRYRQRCDDSFRYVLRTGAYWAGPIGELEVLVRDAEGRVGSARLEGEPPQVRRPGTWRWRLTDVEPRWPLELGLIPDR